MKIKRLVLSSIVAVSCFNSVQAVISKSTDRLFKDGMKSCSTYSTRPQDITEYYNCVGWEVALVSGKPICTKNIKKSLKELGCPEEFVNSFMKAYNIENVEIHKGRLQKIKKEFESFKVKDLTASAQVSKYMNYIENNGLEGLIDVDPEMQKEMRDNKAKFMARKKSCSDVVNVKDPLSLDEPRDQDSVGWCYAYTASDLLSHALGKKVSAVQMAGLFNDKLLGRIMSSGGEGGYVVSTLEAAQKNGVCLESELPSEDYDYSKMASGLSTLFQHTRKLGAHYSQRVSKTTYGKDAETNWEPKFTKEQVKASLCLDFQPILEAYQYLFPKLSIDHISELLLKSGTHAFTEMTKSCTAQKDEALSSLTIKREWRNSRLYPAIDEQLDKGNILGISYHAGMLENSEKGGFIVNHASSIVGRRFNEETMSCEYLLRNSWGTTCSGYSEDYECKKGHVWIGEEFFKHKNSIFEVEYVENK